MARHGALQVIEGLATNGVHQCFLDVGWPRFAVKAINLAPHDTGHSSADVSTRARDTVSNPLQAHEPRPDYVRNQR